MAIWQFEIKQAGKEKVQSIGMRPFIISQMLERGFERGDAINSPDGKRVSVLVECEDRKTMQGFRKTLAMELKLEAKSPYSSLPRHFTVSPIRKQNPYVSCLPELSSKAPAMVLSQTSKGVGVMLATHKEMREMRVGLTGEMRNGFGGLRGEMRNGFGSLRGEMRGMKGEMRGMKGEMRGMKHEMRGVRKELHAGFESLPGRIAKDTNQEMRAIRTELRSGFNRLPNRIAKAIRSSISAT